MAGHNGVAHNSMPPGEDVALERANRALRSRSITELAASAAELTGLATKQKPAALGSSPEGLRQVGLSKTLLSVADALAIEDARRNPVFRDRLHTETVVGAEIAAAVVLPAGAVAEEQRAVRAMLKDAELLTNEKDRNRLVTVIAQDCPFGGLKRQAGTMLGQWGVSLPVAEAPVPAFSVRPANRYDRPQRHAFRRPPMSAEEIRCAEQEFLALMKRILGSPNLQ